MNRLTASGSSLSNDSRASEGGAREEEEKEDEEDSSISPEFMAASGSNVFSEGGARVHWQSDFLLFVCSRRAPLLDVR